VESGIEDKKSEGVEVYELNEATGESRFWKRPIRVAHEIYTPADQ